MSKIDVEKITIAKWIILVGQHGISLLEKGRAAKFNIISARRWGVIHSAVLIENLIGYIPETEDFDLVLDDQMTTVSYTAPAVAHSRTNVTEHPSTVTVKFYDILKSRECTLVSEKSDLNEMVEAFSPFLHKIRRIVLRGPTNDFRYIVYVETSSIIQKPNAWIGSISSDLSSVLLNLPPAGLNSPTNDPLMSVDTADAEETGDDAKPQDANLNIRSYFEQVPTLTPEPTVKVTILPPPLLSPNVTKPDQSTLQPPNASAQIQVDLSPEPRKPVGPKTKPTPAVVALDPVTDQTADQTGHLTLMFSASDAPSIALLAAGVVWSLPRTKGKSLPASITEIGAFRKKLSSPFRRMVGVSAHQETDKLPVTTDRLHSLIQSIADFAQQPGDHILFFGYETLSTELLIHVSRFLQETPVKYQIIVCHDNTAQSDELLDFESVFDGLARKSWIYIDSTDENVPSLQLPSWKTYKTPSLDDAILKKIMLGEFRVFEKLDSDKTNLSILQSHAFAKWVAEFGACTAKS